MAADELYEITLDATLQGQDVSNVYFYREVSTFPAGLVNLRAQAIASSFFLRHFPVVRNMVTSDVAFKAIRCRSLFDAAQKHQILLTQNGNYDVAGGESLPAFNAVSFALSGDNAAVKQGRKRYAGINEAVQSDGILNFLQDFDLRLNGLRDALVAILTDTAEGIVPWATPVVVKRVRSGSPGAYTYRLPETPAEAVFSNVIAAEFSLDITSQISRRKGKGS